MKCIRCKIEETTESSPMCQKCIDKARDMGLDPRRVIAMLLRNEERSELS